MAENLPMGHALRVGSIARVSTGWFGIWTLILTEGSLFGYLLVSYFYLMLQTPLPWPPEGPPKLLMSGINTGILLTSSVFVYLAERCIRHNKIRLSLLPMLIAIGLGIAFIIIQFGEWRKKPYGPTSNLYGSLYFTITGFHMAHVVIGLAVLSFLLLWSALGYFDSRRYAALTLGGLYWHFVDAVWLVIFSSLYLYPHWGQ